MAALAIMLGGLLMAAGLAWTGVQGLRGIPDARGKQTSRGVAVICLVLAVLLAAGSVALPFLIGR
jgi:hypothetical protein